MNRIGYTVLMIALALPVPGAILWRYMNPIPAGSLPIDRPLAAHGDTALCRYAETDISASADMQAEHARITAACSGGIHTHKSSGEALTLRQADQAWPEGRDWPQSGQARADFAAKAIWNSS